MLTEWTDRLVAAKMLVGAGGFEDAIVQTLRQIADMIVKEVFPH